MSITVFSQLSAGTISNNQTICYGGIPSTLTQTAPTGGAGTYTYLWYANGTSTGITTSTYSSGSLTSTTSYICAVTSGGCGPVSSNIITVSVYGNLTAGISGSSSPICYNTNPGTFTASGSGGTDAYTYQWYTSPSSIITGATSSTYNPGSLTALQVITVQ